MGLCRLAASLVAMLSLLTIVRSLLAKGEFDKTILCALCSLANLCVRMLIMQHVCKCLIEFM